MPDFPYARYAEMLGLHGIRVDKAENVGAAWDEAFAARKPVVLEAYTARKYLTCRPTSRWSKRWDSPRAPRATGRWWASSRARSAIWSRISCRTKNSRRAGKTPVTKLEVSAYTVPTDAPEGDGTFDWHETTLVLVEAFAGDCVGIDYWYTDPAAAKLIAATLTKVVIDRRAMNVPGIYSAMLERIRNLGRPGIAATAIAPVDNALWDLKAKLLEVFLLDLLGALRERVPVYGSGGFTTYSDAQLRVQLGGWAAQDFRMVKMKLGRAPGIEAEVARVRVAQESIGPEVELFVDANGAYDRKTALAMSERFVDLDVRCTVCWRA